MTQDLLRKDCVTIFGHFRGRIFIGCKILCLINKTKENAGHYKYISLILFVFLLIHVIYDEEGRMWPQNYANELGS